MIEKTYVANDEWEVMQMDEWEVRQSLVKTQRVLKTCVTAMIIAIVLIVASFIVADNFMPKRAFADEGLTAGTTELTTQATTKDPYVDVIKGKTVDKTGWEAVNYVKSHKGFKDVIKGKRFYPTKNFTQAQFTQILRNLYGKKVKLSKSKTAVTGKYACQELTKVARNVFGVKMTWKAGSTKAKLTRVGAANYIRVFAKWEGGLFKPKQ